MDMTWPYIAGFFDGEGSISVVTRRAASTSCITVSLAQSSETSHSPDVLTHIGAFLAKQEIRHGIYAGKIYEGTRLTNGRTVRTNLTPWKIQIFNRDGVSRFLSGIRPWLIVKKVKAEDVLRFLYLFPDMRGRFSEKVGENVSRAQMTLDREAGFTYKQIAEKHGLSVTAVYERLNREKVTAYRHEWRRLRQESCSIPQE
jgi:hypothetical protein